MPLRLLAAFLSLALPAAALAQAPAAGPGGEAPTPPSFLGDAAAAGPIANELNSEIFVRSSVAGLRYMIEANELAAERPMSETSRRLAAALRRASEGLMRDLIDAMEAGGVSLSADARRIAEQGTEPRDNNALDIRLARELARLRAAKNPDFEGVWLQAMADGLESAQRWWAIYAYKSRDEPVQRFAAAALPTVERLAKAVEAARLERFLR